MNHPSSAARNALLDHTSVRAGERRQLGRVRRRLRVRFEGANRRGFGSTVNLSAGGMLLSSVVVLPPGTVVRGRCFLPSGHAEFDFVARVRWAEKVVATSLRVPGSMGLELVSAPPSEYLEIATRPTSRV